MKYGITAEEAHRFGLPCGGTIQLVLEPLTAQSGIAELCRRVETAGSSRGKSIIETARRGATCARRATDGVPFDGADVC